MAEITTGIRALLARPAVYTLFNWLIGDAAERRIFVREYVRPLPGMRVLDIGCGVANMLPFLGDVAYTGFDHNPAYIAAARRQYGSRGTFLDASVEDFTVPAAGSYDLVLATGVLHHLDDATATTLLQTASAALRSGGRLITFDGVYSPDQSRLARFVVSRDRGQHVRTEDAYVALADPLFGSVRATIRHDLLRIPYTHVILEATRCC